MIGKAENGACGVGVLCSQIERLAERSGAAVVYAHHFYKRQPEEKRLLLTV